MAGTYQEIKCRSYNIVGSLRGQFLRGMES